MKLTARKENLKRSAILYMANTQKVFLNFDEISEELLLERKVVFNSSPYLSLTKGEIEALLSKNWVLAFDNKGPFVYTHRYIGQAYLECHPVNYDMVDSIWDELGQPDVEVVVTEP